MHGGKHFRTTHELNSAFYEEEKGQDCDGGFLHAQTDDVRLNAAVHLIPQNVRWSPPLPRFERERK